MTTVQSLEVEVTDKGGLKRELAFEVPASVINSALDEAYDRIARSTRMPGFRPGKVPRQVIRSRFREQVQDDVLQRLVPDYYQQAVEQSGVEPVNRPEFGPLEINEGKALKVVAMVEVPPSVELAPYDGIELEAVDVEVTDRDIEVAHRSLQESMATLEPAAKTRKAQEGDVAVIDFEGRVDGEPFEGGRGEGYAVTLGEGRFIAGFEEQLVGHKAGEHFDITVTFPEDYHSETLRGREAVFSVTLHEVKKKVLPDVDDSFASQVGDFENLGALNETLREQIRKKRLDDLRKVHRKQVYEKLCADNQFEAPESVVEAELDTLMDNHRRLIAFQGRTLEEAGFDEADARGRYLEDARAEARGQMVVAEIAKKEGITVSEEEFTEELTRIAQEYQRPVSDVEQAVRANPDEMRRLHRLLLKNKVLDALIGRATITVVGRKEEAGTAGKKAPAKKAAAKKSTSARKGSAKAPGKPK